MKICLFRGVSSAGASLIQWFIRGICQYFIFDEATQKASKGKMPNMKRKCSLCSSSFNVLPNNFGTSQLYIYFNLFYYLFLILNFLSSTIIQSRCQDARLTDTKISSIGLSMTKVNQFQFHVLFANDFKFTLVSNRLFKAEIND